MIFEISGRCTQVTKLKMHFKRKRFLCQFRGDLWKVAQLIVGPAILFEKSFCFVP